MKTPTWLQRVLPPPDWAGRLGLLIVQPTPFCNLDCSYCYLPDRQDRHRMTFETLQALADKVFGGGLAAPRLSVVWHAGEPTVVEREWYLNAFELLAASCPAHVRLTHHFQTNAVLVDERWAAFFRDQQVSVGVSVDGPAWIHDRHRKTRNGKGTHARAMAGVEALRGAGVRFHAICVLTREALERPDEIFDFFATLGATQVCFNVEEVEAANLLSSLSSMPNKSARDMHSFMRRILERLKDDPGVFRVREVDWVLGALRSPHFGKLTGNTQNQPGEILSVGWDGEFTTFSPELLGQSAEGLGVLSLGNVHRDPLPPAPDDPRYLAQWQGIHAGIQACRHSCDYFDFCLGGAPANKLGENGRFESTETLACRLSQQAVTDEVLRAVEADLNRLGASPSIAGFPGPAVSGVRHGCASAARSSGPT